jgi:transcriptional regulator with XRE-family HTH domain
MLKDRIKNERKKQNLTQQQLADAIGTTRAAVAQWETGATKTLAGENLINTAKKLHVNPSWLATGKGEKQPPQAQATARTKIILNAKETTQDDKIRLLFHQLPNAEQNIIKIFMGLEPEEPLPEELRNTIINMIKSLANLLEQSTPPPKKQ